ncbi:MAG: ribonuclease HII [Armatimonadetes bacterium]|nr:ribonuclease HII [Armatimonadota bacterium]
MTKSEDLRVEITFPHLQFSSPTAFQPGQDHWFYENTARQDGHVGIVGVDEAGRGPLAGPVVAAAVMLPENFDSAGIRDSKTMTPADREVAFDRIVREAKAIGIGVVGPDVIDEINILRASHRAMRAALDDLSTSFDFVLIDGLPVPDLPAPSLAIVKGDRKSVSIMAASIVAKVTRDRIMLDLDQRYPGYGFAEHKGYCTKAHLAAIESLGPCPCHRKSFAPVAERMRSCRLPGLG